jgi:sodium/potassium-transporting ATPase subunit alpha
MQHIGNPPDPTNLGLGILLIVVILLQAGFSAFQDWSSNKVMKSIKNLMPSSAQVIRDGKEISVQASELVIGDLVLLKYGSKCPADVRIIETSDLKFDKSMLTGESEPIEATVEHTNESYSETKNIGFMTTLITNGNGKGVVVSTGDNTMIGIIAKLTNQGKAKQTSLQKEITRFVVMIVIMAVTTVTILLILWGAWLKVKYPTYIDTSAAMVNVVGLLGKYF